MKNQEEQEGYNFTEAGKIFYSGLKGGQRWRDFYEEKDDFLRGKVPALLPDFSQEEDEE